MSTSTKEARLSLLQAAFQKDLSALWAQKEAYRKLLEESDKTPEQLQFEKRGYVRHEVA